jgi:hypothetical protein
MTARVSIDVEEPVLTGEPFRVAVVIETTKARTTHGVTVRLRGFSTLVTKNDIEQTYKAFGAWTAVLAETERIEPGAHRFEGSLLLPEDAPPCGEGVMEIYYQLDARVRMEVPWVLDATASRRLAVARPTRRERPPPCPTTVSSLAGGDDGLVVELELDDVSFAPGETIQGAFSLGNIRHKEVDAAVVSLVPALPAHMLGSGYVSVFKSLAGVGEGSPVRFSLPLAATAALSFASETLGIDQAVLLHVDGWSVDCRIPVVIDTFEPREGQLLPAPPVGRARWRFAWRDEGTRAGLALEGRDLSLHGTLAGAVDAQVQPRGSGVQATLTWESLGVGLSILPRVLLPGGVSLDDVDPLFGKRFIARGHEPAQVLAALGRDLCAALLAFEDAQLDDAGAEVATSASARDPEALRSFLAALEALAEAVVAAERRLPPPSWVDAATAEAWRAFAAATTGRLHAGRMAITGALVDGDRTDVETLCDARGRTRATRLTLMIDPPADRVSQLPDDADADLRRSVQDRDLARPVEIRPDSVVLELVGTTADPATLRAPMAEMARLARRLRGETSRGPYR